MGMNQRFPSNAQMMTTTGMNGHFVTLDCDDVRNESQNEWIIPRTIQSIVAALWERCANSFLSRE